MHKSSKDILENYLQINDKDKLNEDKIDSFCRLLLREDIGDGVYYKNMLRVFIGYDYLMGIHTSKSLEPIVLEIEQMGLCVERF